MASADIPRDVTNVQHMTVVGMLVLVLAACGMSGSPDDAQPPALEGVDHALVRFEAQWLCDVQRHTYPTLDQMDAARAELMTSFRVTAAAHDDFKGRLGADAGLRAQVRAAYDSACGV